MNHHLRAVNGLENSHSRHSQPARESTTGLVHLVYISSAVSEFSRSDLRTLLAKSHHNNKQASVSGLLLYRGGNIMQLLEGTDQAVTATFSRIRKDPRHTDVTQLLHEPIVQRSFPDSSMGFRDLTDVMIRDHPGYSEFLNEDWYTQRTIDTPNRALKLLLVFRRTMR